MRVLYIVNVIADNKNPSAEPFVKSQIDSIKKTGVDVVIYNIKGNESKLNYLTSIFRIRKLAKKLHFDIVHGHYVYSGIVAASQRRAPSVVSYMGSDLLGSPRSDGRLQFRGHIDVRLSKLLQYFVDGIIIKSRRMQDALVEKTKSTVLPNGVDFDFFRELPRNKARAKLGLDNEMKYVLFAGNYKNPRKAFHVVRKAVKILKSKGENVELLLACGLPHDQVPYYMNAANILALSSIHEGSPNVIKEAMACNLPIVATDVGDVKEVIAGTEGCRIVDRTPEDFAKNIREILNTVGKTKGRKAIEHLRIEKVAQRLVDFYEDVLNSKTCRKKA
jgi:teichuronic acid biosynthesis glycosyltransferase TuaC